MKKKNLQYLWVTREEFIPIYRKYRAKIDSRVLMPTHLLRSKNEHEKTKRLRDQVVGINCFYLLVMDGEKVVGWSFGEQKDSEEFHMVHSAVLPIYRRQKVYTTMLDKIIKKVSQEGFQFITSTHNPSNPAILIAKLKKGFVITGMRVDECFGMQIVLSYFVNPKIRAVMDYRVGYKDLDKKLKKMMS